MGMAATARIAFGRDQHMLAESGQMMITDRTTIRRRLAVRRTAHRPPWGRRKSGHRSIVAPLAATLTATVAVGIGVALARAERERRVAKARLPRHDRRFGLLTSEPAADGLKRIALGQLDLAIELLNGKSSVPPERCIHETRKALKRLCALMRLLEQELGEKRSKRERATLRNAARRLSSARDTEVMVKTLDSLFARHPHKLGQRRGLIELRAHLAGKRLVAVEHALGDTATRSQVAEELRAVRRRVTKWKLSEQRSARLMEPGLKRIYREGRAGLRRADRSSSPRRKSDPAVLHSWRKHVKDLRYAAEILDVQNPVHGVRAREAGRIDKLARQADTLGELLGEEHDLALLAARVRAHKPLRQHKRARKLLLRTIARRRASLRKRALRDGLRLYQRKPKRFVRRIFSTS